MSVVDVYRQTRKAQERWWDLYVCRPVAAVVVYALKDTRITPNQLTLASLVVALGGAAVLLGWPGYLGLVFGILLLEAAYVLDCADGMLARLRGTASPAGHLLDFLMDELKAFVLVGVVAVRLYQERAEPRFLLLGILGLVVVATGIAITTFQRRPEVSPPGAPAVAGTVRTQSRVRRLIALGERGGKLLIHYPSYIYIPAALGHIEVFLCLYVAVNALYALRSLAWLAWRFGR
jgi:phosphatidylglycerophosphate synthase